MKQTLSRRITKNNILNTSKSVIHRTVSRQRQRLLFSSLCCILFFFIDEIRLFYVPKTSKLSFILNSNFINIYGFGIIVVNLSSLLVNTIYLCSRKNRKIYSENSEFVEKKLFSYKIYINLLINALLIAYVHDEIVSTNNVLLIMVLLFGNFTMVFFEQLSNMYGLFSVTSAWYMYSIIKSIECFNHFVYVLLVVAASWLFFSFPQKIVLVGATEKKRKHIIYINNIHEHIAEDVLSRFFNQSIFRENFHLAFLFISISLDLFSSFFRCLPYEMANNLEKQSLFIARKRKNIYSELVKKIILSCFLSSTYNFLLVCLSRQFKCVASSYIARDWNSIYDFICCLQSSIRVELFSRC